MCESPLAAGSRERSCNAQRLRRSDRLFCKAPRTRRRSDLAEAVSAEYLSLMRVAGQPLLSVHHPDHHTAPAKRSHGHGRGSGHTRSRDQPQITMLSYALLQANQVFGLTYPVGVSRPISLRPCKPTSRSRMVTIATDAMFLTRDELVDLTGKQRGRSQAEVLRAIGVEHKIRPDGRVLVLRRHVEELFGVKSAPNSASEVDSLINWDAA
ncbi:uncharacterized protein DUF4224 [Paraburkholderia sp. BL6665CI2N2]|nr:uncharacterized protein DUF4224 [Paraburkholderia sp. BL6665CI2N2]